MILNFLCFWHFFHLNLLIKRACNCQITWWICTFRIHIWIIWTIWLCSNSFLKSEHYLYSYSFHFQKMNTICICMRFKITICSNSDWSPKVQGFQGPGVPRSQGQRYVKLTFKYELDSKEGPSCFLLSFENVLKSHV